MITRDIYGKFLYDWYDERHVKPINGQCQFCVKQRLYKLEHPDLLT